MKHTALALALAAGLMASPVAAVAQDPVPAADRSDMECAALFAIMAGSDPQYEASAAIGMAYYVGRLEGRNPGQNQVVRLFEWLNTQSEDQLVAMLDPAGVRCSQELQTLGNTMTEVGSSLAD
jgi:hypothetical protein